PQFPLMREAVKAFGLIPIEEKGYEADDIIATYSRQALEQGADVTIIGGDKDMMQLVKPGINMYDPMPGNERRIGPDEVREKFGVPPEKVPEVQALIGDSTDNVPGVPGIGVKTAAQLIGEFGDLETLLSRTSEIKQEKRRQSLVEFAEQVVARTAILIELQAFASVFVTEIAGQKVDRARYASLGDAASLDQAIAKAFDRGIVAVDLVTTSADPMIAELIGISLAVEPGEACYIPLGHRGS